MSCPDYVILEQNLTFTINTIDTGGSPVNADAAPAYSIYEDETAAAISTGTMTQPQSVTGFYSEQIAITTANGYERYKTYSIRITAVISGVTIAKSYSFIALAGSDVVTATTGALTTVSKVNDFLDISGDDTLIALLINRATSAIQRYCDRTFIAGTYREYHNANDEEILLRNYPVINIKMFSTVRTAAFGIKNNSGDAYNAFLNIIEDTSAASSIKLTVAGGANDGVSPLTISDYTTMTLLQSAISALDKGWEMTSLSSDMAKWNPKEILVSSGRMALNNTVEIEIPFEPEFNYVTDYPRGIIHPTFTKFLDEPKFFNAGAQSVIIKYRAGYETIPADLEQICIDLVGVYYFSRSKDLSVKSEKLGDYAYTRSDDGNLPGSIRTRLSAWRRYSI